MSNFSYKTIMTRPMLRLMEKLLSKNKELGKSNPIKFEVEAWQSGVRNLGLEFIEVEINRTQADYVIELLKEEQLDCIKGFTDFVINRAKKIRNELKTQISCAVPVRRGELPNEEKKLTVEEFQKTYQEPFKPQQVVIESNRRSKQNNSYLWRR